MSEYDVTTRGGPRAFDLSGPSPQGGIVGGPPEPAEPSTLELLRQAAEAEKAARDEEEETSPIVLYSPGRKIRLTCSHIRDEDTFKVARKFALPPEERKKAQPNESKFSTATFSAKLIADQVTEVAIQNGDGRYRPVVGDDGTPITLADQALLRILGAAEAVTAVRRIFIDDAPLIKAGTELSDLSGWGEEADAEDPPALSRRERRSSTG